MAIINSSAIGKASGSIGPLTYRTVRGRIIVSARITTNNSRTEKQLKHRAAFSEMQRLAKSLKTVIEAGFDTTQYGTTRNNFHRLNTPYMHYIRHRATLSKPTNQQASAPQPTIPLHNLWLALSDPHFKGQVLASSGHDHTASAFSWDANNLPCVRVAHSRSFCPGDTLTLVLAITYLHTGKRHHRLLTINKRLTGSLISSCSPNSHLTLDAATCPRLNFRPILPAEATDICISAAAFITSPDGARSTSCFTAMPAFPVAQPTLEAIAESALETKQEYTPQTNRPICAK